MLRVPLMTEEIWCSHLYPRGANGSNFQSFQFVSLGKPKCVAKYDGKSSWSDYLVQFEIAAQPNGWNENQKAMELPTNLEEMTRDVLSDVKPEHRLNFAVLVDKLMQRFEPDGQVIIYQSQLQNQKHRCNEAISELVQGPVLLTLLRHVTRILANGRAAFFESCDAIGWNSCDVSQKR